MSAEGNRTNKDLCLESTQVQKRMLGASVVVLGKGSSLEQSSGAATMPPVVSGCAEQELLSYHIMVTGQVIF